jgi:hypothetical protein
MRLRLIRKRPSGTRGKRGEQGYALLLAVFLTTLMVIAAVVAAPSVRTEGQREKEEEMIWRGRQYVRAIKLYYRKNGRFPQNLDDLIKPKQGSLRYLRQAYKDPMNKEDGKWRLIFVGPAGQLIGSTKPPQLLQLQGPGGTSAPGTPSSSFGSSSFGSSQGNTSTMAPGSVPGTASSNTANQGVAGTTGQGLSADTGSAQNFTPVDTSSFVGGNIIGVGSKANKASVIIYEKATNYHQFEFIWDPSKDTMAIGGGATPNGAPVNHGQQNPGTGFGGSSTFGNQPGQQQPQPSQPGNPTPPPQDTPLPQ